MKDAAATMATPKRRSRRRSSSASAGAGGGTLTTTTANVISPALRVPAAGSGGGSPRKAQTTTHGGLVRGEGTTAVYVRDAHYAWLPARVVTQDHMGSSSHMASSAHYSSASASDFDAAAAEEEDEMVTVSVSLPPDWISSTVLVPDSGLEDLEDATANDDYYDSRTSTSSNKRLPSAASLRTVRLSEYPNAELPLQNLDVDGRSPLPPGGKPDMADLPFLHEAAILYNLKDRHSRSLPYTRVGDIVVAVNPFRWIDGLYGEDKQSYYAERIVWTAPPKEEGEDGEDESDVGTEKKNDDSTGDGAAGAVSPSASVDDAPLYSRSSSAVTTATASAEKEASDYVFDKLGHDPHIYETSCLSYRNLALDRQNQTILVSGESGAGKTETVKIVMSHLATIERTRPFYPYTDRSTNRNQLGSAETVQRVLESNPVFEAFGNAKTVRNDNSSRFGRFTQLQFDVEDAASARNGNRDVPSTQLAGSKVATYLLEKSRVVGHGPNERTYHVFYQLLASSDDTKRDIWEEGLVGSTCDTFSYVGPTVTHSIEGRTDAEGWARTVEALSTFGIVKDELRALMRALCAVLQLGNLVFGEAGSGEGAGGADDADGATSSDDDDIGDEGDGDGDGDGDDDEDRSVIVSTAELDKLSSLLGTPSAEIAAAMTRRRMVARGEEFIIHLRPDAAKDGCDALAKEIYSRVFDVLVRRINEYTAAEHHHYEVKKVEGAVRMPRSFGTISMLDIFGFERFDVNRFEQLCINYANERLQQKYVLDNFKAVQQEYEAEGIEIFDFTLVDNSDVLTLLEGKLGLIVSLNEECVRPKGSDESFVYKLKMVHTDSERLIQDNLHMPYEFAIKHFAGPVKYDATKFLERNADKIPQDLLDCACRSTNELIRDEFQSVASAIEQSKAGVRRRSSVASQTVVSKFRSQLSTLMVNIESTRTRYIRCIKPNTMMKPAVLDHRLTVGQLECAGLVTAITISRESFPNRLSYEVVLDRFKCLVEEDSDEQSVGSYDSRVEVNNILSKLLADVASDRDESAALPFACGKTKIYFRAGALERLETARMEYFALRAVKMQTWSRSVIASWKYRLLKKATISLQALYRSQTRWRTFARQKRASVVLQCFARTRRARLDLLKRREKNAATQIQKRWRIVKPRNSYKRLVNAVLVIQRFSRKVIHKKSFTIKMAECVEEARMDNKLSQLQQMVSDEASVGAHPAEAAAAAATAPVDEKLLEEIETMFDYLKKEIYTLRTKSSDLKAELEESEADKREMFNHAKSIEHSYALSKLRAGQLAKTNTALISEVMSHKQDMNELKRELKTQQASHEKQLEEMRREFNVTLGHREVEVKSLEAALKGANTEHALETSMMRNEFEKSQEESFTEILRLKEELKQTQDSHHDYLAKLMDVLESTHAARESEAAKVNEKLSVVRDEKDAEISKLKREIRRLKVSKDSEAKEISGKLMEKNQEVKSMKAELEKAKAERKERSRQFHSLSKQLEAAFGMQRSAPEVEESPKKSILRRKSKAAPPISSSAARSDEEVERLKLVNQTMKELYEAEERSHARLDRYVDAGKYDELREENRRLKQQLEQLEQTNTCKTCDFRRQRASALRKSPATKASARDP